MNRFRCTTTPWEMRKYYYPYYVGREEEMQYKEQHFERQTDAGCLDSEHVCFGLLFSMIYCHVCLVSQARLGPVAGADAAPGEDVVPEPQDEVEENGTWFVAASSRSLKSDFQRTGLEAEHSVGDLCLLIPNFLLFLITFLRNMLFLKEFILQHMWWARGTRGSRKSKQQRDAKNRNRTEGRTKISPSAFLAFLRS